MNIYKKQVKAIIREKNILQCNEYIQETSNGNYIVAKKVKAIIREKTNKNEHIVTIKSACIIWWDKRNIWKGWRDNSASWSVCEFERKLKQQKQRSTTNINGDTQIKEREGVRVNARTTNTNPNQNQREKDILFLCGSFLTPTL